MGLTPLSFGLKAMRNYGNVKAIILWTFGRFRFVFVFVLGWPDKVKVSVGELVVFSLAIRGNEKPRGVNRVIKKSE